MSRLMEKLRKERDRYNKKYGDSRCQLNPIFLRELEALGMTGKTSEALLTREQLARYLSLSQSYVSKLQAEEGLPIYRIGTAVRFRLGEVEKWLKERKRYE